MTRVGIAGLWHETNTYSSRATSLEDFERFELLRGDEIVRRHAGAGSVIGGMLGATSSRPVPIVSAGAWPGGRVREEALTELLDLLERELERAAPLAGMLLNLHGAMVAEGCDDVEQAVVRRVRALVGDVPVVAVLDLHGNPSAEFVRLCEGIVAYDTYPHIDMHERGREAVALLVRAMSGTVFRTHVRKLPLLSCPLAQATDRAPMRDLALAARRLAREPLIDRISLLPGFPYSDVSRAGFSVLVTHQPDGEETAHAAAAELVELVEANASAFSLQRDGPAEAVERALQARQRPVVLVDVADNVGGGAPGDGTAILEELLAQRARGAVVQLADPDAARSAARAGPGSRFEADVGAKTDRRHGRPVRVRGRVVRVTDGRYGAGGSWMTGLDFTMGTTAVVEAAGLTLVLNEHPVPPFHAEQLESVAIHPRGAAIVVVKGAVAWRAAYGEIAGTVIEVDTPGICPLDPTTLKRATDPVRL